MEKTRITKLLLDGHMGVGDLQCLRGAVNRLLSEGGEGGDAHVLFHNHQTHGLRYGYPMVQFRSINGQAAVVGIGDAAESVRALASLGELRVKLGERNVTLPVSRCEETFYTPQVYDAPKLYSLYRYIALTDKNVREYDNLLALTDRVIMLEKILVGNMLSFFKGIGFHTDDRLEAVITAIDGEEFVTYKGVKFRTFHLHFVSNVELPDGIGLGKSTAVGFGSLRREKLDEKYLKRYSNG